MLIMTPSPFRIPATFPARVSTDPGCIEPEDLAYCASCVLRRPCSWSRFRRLHGPDVLSMQNPGGPDPDSGNDRLSALLALAPTRSTRMTAPRPGRPRHRGTLRLRRGTIEPARATTSAATQATITHGADVPFPRIGRRVGASMDVSLAAPLTLYLSSSRAEKNVPVTLTATFTGDTSPPLRFVWNFGDGKSAATDVATVTHTWADDGRVTITVSVTDAIDRKGGTSLSIVVRDNP